MTTVRIERMHKPEMGRFPGLGKRHQRLTAALEEQSDVLGFRAAPQGLFDVDPVRERQMCI